MILGVSVAARAIDVGTTQVITTDDAQTLLGAMAVACRVRRISWVSTLAGTISGGIVFIRDGGAANPTSSDELETTICHLWG